MGYAIEPWDDMHTVCEECGAKNRTISGGVFPDEPQVAFYQVFWSEDGGDHHDEDVAVQIVLGSFEDKSGPEDRYLVALWFRPSENSFMVVDADQYRESMGHVAGRFLGRDEVVDQPLAQQVYDIVDEIWLNDPRLPVERVEPGDEGPDTEPGEDSEDGGP